jgi:hypothetical protein
MESAFTESAFTESAGMRIAEVSGMVADCGTT